MAILYLFSVTNYLGYEKGFTVFLFQNLDFFLKCFISGVLESLLVTWVHAPVEKFLLTNLGES